MRILITNDDGIDAAGINCLADGLQEYDLTICAPSSQRSASSHSVTYFFGDHAFTKRGENRYAVDGTPADCVYFGVHAFMKEKPDLIISGINHGQNLSTDVIYSGTVGAASEGMTLGIPSMAVSLCDYDSKQFAACVQAVKILIPQFLKDPDNKSYVLNVNVPAVKKEEIKGFRITHLEGSMEYRNEVTAVKHANGTGMIHTRRIAVKQKESDPDPDGDVTAVREGYISLTPLDNEMTAAKFIEHIRKYEYLHWKDNLLI